VFESRIVRRMLAHKREEQETEEICIMRSFIICAFDELLLE
jgi:hypothetical protein